MTNSSSIAIGRSFITSVYPMNVDQLIDMAAHAAQENPEVAAEITLATTEEVLSRLGVQECLRITMQNMVNRLCVARDLSVLQ